MKRKPAKVEAEHQDIGTERKAPGNGDNIKFDDHKRKKHWEKNRGYKTSNSGEKLNNVSDIIDPLPSSIGSCGDDSPYDCTNLSAMTKDEAASFRKEMAIRVIYPNGSNTDKNADLYPISSFMDAQKLLPPGLVNCCKDYKKMSPIQSQSWPIAFSSKDLIGIAETGSGKTIAFAVPAIAHVIKYKNSNRKQGVSSPEKEGPLVLVLAPTRELAIQINEAFVRGISSLTAGDGDKPKSACIYGGADRRAQSLELSLCPEIVIGTPGRILDFISDSTLSLCKISFFVLDEADRMLDLGFAPDVKRLILAMGPKSQRQTLMFSATWPMSIRKLASECMNDPVQIVIGSHDEDTCAADRDAIPNGSVSTLRGGTNIQQIVQVVGDPMDRVDILSSLLSKYQDTPKRRLILFVLYKKEADRIESLLTKKGWKCGSLHGDKPQSTRERVLDSFKKGTISILIATDVAARGLDIPDVETVVNFTFPLTIEDYVHRIGRTGRAGNSGIAHTLFTPIDKSHSGELIKVLKNSGQPVPQELYQFGTTIKKKEHKDYGAHYKELDPNIKSTHVKFD